MNPMQIPSANLSYFSCQNMTLNGLWMLKRYACCWLKAHFQPCFSLLLFGLFRKVNTFYWHVAKLWSLICTKQSTTASDGWILLGLPLFLLTCLLWVLHCKIVMVMGPHSLQLCFLYLPSFIVKTFCDCSEDQFLADHTLEIPTQ